MKVINRLILMCLCVLPCAGCSTYIVPPPMPAGSGVPVHIADYGYHSTIILPRMQGALVEYAYGDWDYFGLSHKSFSTGVKAMLASEQATLGRRVVEASPEEPGFEKALGASAVVTFWAPREKVAELEEALEQRFSMRLDSIQYSDIHHLYFVKDDEPYGIGHNCNHFTAQWLERLGCKVEGLVLGSKFKVKELPEGVVGNPAIPKVERPVELAGHHAPLPMRALPGNGRVPTTQARGPQD